MRNYTIASIYTSKRQLSRTALLSLANFFPKTKFKYKLKQAVCNSRLSSQTKFLCQKSQRNFVGDYYKLAWSLIKSIN